ncbi:hypothetical protein TNCV_1444661 [Trichonephila clavipes]|nr:hypothetical protein TNCV_1444661 [Trichonephila clavipes]
MSLVYAEKPETLDHLEVNIRRVIADIRPQMLEKVIENRTSRLDYIRASRGSPMPEIIFKIKEKKTRLGGSGKKEKKNKAGGIYQRRQILNGSQWHHDSITRKNDRDPRVRDHNNSAASGISFLLGESFNECHIAKQQKGHWQRIS